MSARIEVRLFNAVKLSPAIQQMDFNFEGDSNGTRIIASTFGSCGRKWLWAACFQCKQPGANPGHHAGSG
jgi:hypothetical protein